ncbi:tetratricopeptide repeat-containing sensor histidine kinase [Tenacibaculum agarivorans]|uniref:tetratricopeptide repeat-containing sensor histidine kinase n=1 Tax=Tenacibaculum agarivorans TaxID=1908389 RepID=UPI0009FB4E53|nr:histidine kinase [Tenacibaculum agarivorans]
MRKMTAFYFVILCLFSCNQPTSIKTIQEATNKVVNLQELARNSQADNVIFDHLKKSEKILRKYPEISDTLHVEHLFLKGNYFKRKNNLDSARHYFYKVITTIKGPNERAKHLAYFKNAWEMEEREDNIANAISIAEKFIDITDDEKLIDDVLYAYNYLGRAYLDLGNYKEAIKYNNKTLQAARETNNLDMFVITANFKAQSYYFSNQKEKAFTLLDSLQTINSGLESKRQLNTMIGILWFFENDIEKSVKYYNKAIQLVKEIAKSPKSNKSNSNYRLLESYNNITEAYLELKNYAIAEKYLDSTKAIIHANSYQPYVDLYHKYRFLFNYRTNKKESKVLEEYENLLKESKIVQQQKIEEKLYALQLANEKEKKVLAEKNELALRNVKLFAFSGISILLLIVGFLFYRQRSYTFQKHEIQMQQRLLRSQMNSHFSFNTLSVIQNQIKEDQELAASYLTKFSRLLRLLLTNSLSNYVLIENELELLKKYLDLQLYRFPNEFEYNIQLENFEEDEPLYIPPMLIQPFIENSIEHGFSHIDYKGKLTLQLKLIDDTYLRCSINDNGIGLKANDSKYKMSISTDLIAKFIEKVTKRKIVILDNNELNPEEKGVYVEFLIPYKFTNHD